VSSIRHRSGAEGPSHDPYGFEEVEVRNARGRFTLHLGLAKWVEVRLTAMDLKPVRFECPRITEPEIEAIFEVGAGVSVATARRTEQRLRDSRYRAHRAHGGFECASGMPGESLTVCRCGAVVECDFDEGAVL